MFVWWLVAVNAFFSVLVPQTMVFSISCVLSFTFFGMLLNWIKTNKCFADLRYLKTSASSFLLLYLDNFIYLLLMLSGHHLNKICFKDSASGLNLNMRLWTVFFLHSVCSCFVLFYCLSSFVCVLFLFQFLRFFCAVTWLLVGRSQPHLITSYHITATTHMWSHKHFYFNFHIKNSWCVIPHNSMSHKTPNFL